jgi:hypothetical protein
MLKPPIESLRSDNCPQAFGPCQLGRLHGRFQAADPAAKNLVFLCPGRVDMFYNRYE